MPRHWTAYMMGGATQPQADLLDKLALDLDKLADRLDEAGARPPNAPTKPWRRARHGRGVLEWAGVQGAPTQAQASMAIDFAKAKIAAREAILESPPTPAASPLGDRFLAILNAKDRLLAALGAFDLAAARDPRTEAAGALARELSRTVCERIDTIAGAMEQATEAEETAR